MTEQDQRDFVNFIRFRHGSEMVEKVEQILHYCPQEGDSVVDLFTTVHSIVYMNDLKAAAEMEKMEFVT